MHVGEFAPATVALDLREVLVNKGPGWEGTWHSYVPVRLAKVRPCECKGLFAGIADKRTRLTE